MKHDSFWTIIKENITTVLAILGMVATLGNLWLASSVAPLATRISEVQAQVTTIEKTIDLTGDNQSQQRQDLNARLERIENKLDQILGGR